MPHRPLTSAGGHRPQTATALPGQSQGFDRDPQYTYSIDEEDEDDESDAEDLFAFLPPSTADQEKQRQEHTDSQLADSPARHQPDADGMFAVSLPSSHTSPISPPPPTYDPNTRYPISGPSGIHLPISPLPVESPPSTGSQQPHSSSDGAYQMRRVKPSSTRSGSTGNIRSRTSGVSSREVHVALPSPLQKSIEERSSGGKRKSMTTVDTNSFTPSMLEQDSREGSVK
jgi:hypothetical protein